MSDEAKNARVAFDRPVSYGETGGGEAAYDPCGGCGNADPDNRCLGCLHPFVATTTDERAVEALRTTTAHLVAAVSLLKRGGKKAAPSDKMFHMMIADYEKAIAQGRAALAQGESR